MILTNNMCNSNGQKMCIFQRANKLKDTNEIMWLLKCGHPLLTRDVAVFRITHDKWESAHTCHSLKCHRWPLSKFQLFREAFCGSLALRFLLKKAAIYPCLKMFNLDFIRSFSQMCLEYFRWVHVKFWYVVVNNSKGKTMHCLKHSQTHRLWVMSFHSVSKFIFYTIHILIKVPNSIIRQSWCASCISFWFPPACPVTSSLASTLSSRVLRSIHVRKENLGGEGVVVVMWDHVTRPFQIILAFD